MATHSIFLPGEFHGQRSLGATCVQGVTKSWTRLSNYHKLVSYLSFFFSYCESRDFSLKQLILILSKKAVNF